MKRLDINHYSTFSALKASIVERFNRTLKNMMWKEFSNNGNYRWTGLLNTLVNKYNSTRHHTIKMRLIDVENSNEVHLLPTVYKKRRVLSRPRYIIGDYVRVSKYKHVFEKGYTPNWSTEVFKINEVKKTEPRTYILEDYQGILIQGEFYELELTAVKHPDAYLVEKVLKRKGSQVFVKWLGFPSVHNSWINIKDVL